jgi:RNA polymerase sigma factor (sigma-70 family)
MMMTEDMELLRQYARHHSEDAFATLVSRHINLVYSVALRQIHDASLAEEVTQAAFIILARKAGSLGPKTALSAWLCRTAQYAAANALRAECRRQGREQEIYMQSLLSQSESETSPWPEIARLLDVAMAELSEKDHCAIVLRFFEGKDLKQVGAALGVNENTAKTRVSRAVEKLRKYFVKRGVILPVAVLTASISANSIQAAPVTLAKSVTAVALAKGATASGSTLALIKGAVKLMTWAKVKSAMMAGATVLLVAGATPIIVKEIQENRTYSWEIPKVYDPAHASFDFGLDTTPPQVRIKPSIYTNFHGWGTSPGFGYVLAPDGTAARTNYNNWQSIGLGVPLADIVIVAYDGKPQRTIYSIKMPPKPLYDFISNLRHGTAQPLQELIKKKFGIVARRELRETDVLLVKLADTNAPAFKPAGTLMRRMNISGLDPLNYAMGIVWKWVEGQHGVPIGQTHLNVAGDDLFEDTGELGIESAFQLPIINETGLTNRYDYTWLFPQ